jgi:hypothetical protein
VGAAISAVDRNAVRPDPTAISTPVTSRTDRNGVVALAAPIGCSVIGQLLFQPKVKA